MRQGHSLIGHDTEVRQIQLRVKDALTEDFVLEKSIFNNVFEKDIRRVFIYKKAERLAKAIHLIAPAFAESVSLRNRIDAIAVGLVDAAILSHSAARGALSRELLALSSVLGIARTGGFLSSMNADLIAREAHILLQEVAAYEEPRMFLDDSPTLAEISKQQNSNQKEPKRAPQISKGVRSAEGGSASGGKGQIKDRSRLSDTGIKDRREAIMSVIRDKGKASIKDISTLFRDVSEKTIQRELIALINSGLVLKEGERRWSTYSLA